MIVIHTKRGCPYCEKAKLLLFHEGLKYKEIEYVPGSPNYETRRQALIESTFHGTFPQVFVDNKFLGGYTELLHEVRAGRLQARPRAETKAQAQASKGAGRRPPSSKEGSSSSVRG